MKENIKMANPEDVKPNNFQVDEILYNYDGFSIAWGKWENGEMHLAMRWNGEEDAGFPQSFGHPVWFLIPSNLTISIISCLLANPNSNSASVVKTISSMVQ